MEKLILVDENDNPTGEMEKMEAHKRGLLHRAFSIFIFHDNKLLLQQRDISKYHSGGLWTNTCCGHPRPGEETKTAAHRRLFEEMGFDCELKEKFSFKYKAQLDADLTENEYDHVFFGIYDGAVNPDPKEAMAYKWVDWDELCSQVKQNPEQFTYWFKIALDKIIARKN